MNITLSAELERFIADQINAGRFDSSEEVIAAAITQLRDQENISQENLNDLRGEIDIGIAEADRKDFGAFTAKDIIAAGHAAIAGKKKAV